jgi:polysaccharide export outer membrane protein
MAPVFLVGMLIFCCWGVRAQDVRLRAGDTIKLDVPQRDDLSRLLDIDQRGDVLLPVVGTVRVEGLTIEEARTAILRALQELYPSVRDVSVSLIGVEARTYVYVQGQVARPDKYDFSLASNIWDAIREAGGVTATASLEAIRLIRVEGDSTATTFVNVQAALDRGDLSTLPALRPGDTVIVPEKIAAALASTGSVIVVGAVESPAPYYLSSDKRLVDALLAAGGWTDYAALGKVTVIRPLAQGGSRTMCYDLTRYLETGDMRHNPPVYPGDTVSVPRKSSILAIFTNPAFLLGIITTAATVTAIIITQR